LFVLSSGSQVSHVSNIPSQQYGFIAEQSTHEPKEFSHLHVHVYVDGLYVNHIEPHFVHNADCAVKLSTLCQLYVELHTGASIVIGLHELSHHPFHQFFLLESFGSHVSQ
jgi:hypothetical protein